MSTIIIHTSEGDIKINLFDEQTPKTVENFLGLASGKKEWTDPFTGKPSHEAFYEDVYKRQWAACAAGAPRW